VICVTREARKRTCLETKKKFKTCIGLRFATNLNINDWLNATTVTGWRLAHILNIVISQNERTIGNIFTEAFNLCGMQVKLQSFDRLEQHEHDQGKLWNVHPGKFDHNGNVPAGPTEPARKLCFCRRA
jgi:hypothetical protein